MKHLLIISCLSLFCFGCASVIHGTTQDISISANPDGCIAKAEDGQQCKPPCKLELKRKTDHVINISKEGYETQSLNIQHVLSGAVAGNILAGGLIGWGVDAATGAQYRLVPELINVELKQLIVVERQPETFDAVLSNLQKLEKLRATGAISFTEYASLKSSLLNGWKGQVPPVQTGSKSDVSAETARYELPHNDRVLTEKTIEGTPNNGSSSDSHDIRIPSAKKALGYKVYTSSGDYLGEVIAVFDKTFVVQGNSNKSYEIFASESSFKEIDSESKKMVVIRWR